MSLRAKTCFFLAGAAIASAGPVLASDNPGAHQHGHAELQLAIKGEQIDLLFTSPAYNLVGFEHRARSDDQKALVNEVTNWLGQTPLADTSEGGCAVMNAVVHHQAGGDDHGHSHGHDHPDESSHSDFEVTQTLSCPGLGSSQALATPITTRFSGIEHLGVQWVRPQGQGSARLGHGESRFELRSR
ncbi:ZrgA family zinc uptake protein [Marinobacter manganoxydans]|uniref:ABC-type metal ion transport system, periplasmic component/surface adhesin n=1 Tax=Marinobacter manganoxydans MnI7-9 TaxID=1094979 RepID=G6YQ38_9GAMM|nr:DUF2796 domain-containing protein [Marinobacter manganoxydans]EHJ05626.1 ABC-type metal ion transport system, periplasmic component/surface adhesin [Marinobacter manganoxydans MnI7-9]